MTIPPNRGDRGDQKAIYSPRVYIIIHEPANINVSPYGLIGLLVSAVSAVSTPRKGTPPVLFCSERL